jgi:hypothetical protein
MPKCLSKTVFLGNMKTEKDDLPFPRNKGEKEKFELKKVS